MAEKKSNYERMKDFKIVCGPLGSEQFVEAFNRLSDRALATSERRGQWSEDEGSWPVEAFMAITDEAEEFWGSVSPGRKSTVIHGFSEAEEELADTVIACISSGRKLNLRLAEAIVAKLKYNETRED